MAFTKGLLKISLVFVAAGTCSAGWINSGTPPGVPEDYDCAVRIFTYNQGRALLPERGDFRTFFEALQLQNCNLTTPESYDRWQPPRLTSLARTSVFVSQQGDDSAKGSLDFPVKSVEKAVALAAEAAQASEEAVEIVLRAGTYHLKGTVDLSGKLFAHGVRIRNFEGEHAIVSGGQPLAIPSSLWQRVEHDYGWKRYDSWNNVYALVPVAKENSSCCSYLGTFESLQECEDSATAFMASGMPLSSYVWHKSITGDFQHSCYAVKQSFGFHPVAQEGVVTGRKMSMNLWKAFLSQITGTLTPEFQRILSDGEGFPGLRLDGRRAIRAKYPDGDPEQAGNWLFGADQNMGGGDYIDGFVRDGFTKWQAPQPRVEAETITITGEDWPGVEWPKSEPGGETKWTGEGDFGLYHMAVGGYCEGVTPPVGYWCGNDAPRGIMGHRSPSGIVNASAVLPHFRNYSSTSTVSPVMNAWRGDGRWYTWQFLVDEADQQTDSLRFSSSRGGHQGGEGVEFGGQWWIENVLEECDSPNEFFYDPAEKALYYSFNGSDPIPQTDGWVVPVHAVLFNITSSGTVISGIELRDSRITYLEPHGLPSGGDWALERLAAIVIENADNVTVSDCHLTRLDGNGIMINGRAHNTALLHNELSYIGATAMAAWGFTGDCLNANCSMKLPAGSLMGPDGRDMNVPFATRVERNLVYEVGIWQKQSSMWFQAVTAKTQILGNVHFNGPRAGINFNDGFGGGDIIADNVIGNCVRESGDHGPFNSWDRVPYITTLRTGQPSIIPATRHYTRNIWLGTYSTQSGIDTDDGSSYILVDFNVFAYGNRGQKSDFGGHSIQHSHNLYIFVHNCFDTASDQKDGTGDSDVFTSNSCLLQPGGEYFSDCGDLQFGMQVNSNQIYTQDGDIKVCNGKSLAKHVQESGLDKGSSVAAWPTPEGLVEAAKRLLTPPLQHVYV